MIARAPGKVVISGAYAVLDGAPALVSAIDRYVSADAGRAGDFVTDEVRAALGERAAPWFDASALRKNERKLGLGSSAAILVASLAAVEIEKRGPLEDRALAAAVFEPALAAHRAAQRGGSGIDVAASVHGGTLLAIRQGAGLLLEPVPLPSALSCQVFACEEAASTPELIARVRALRSSDPSAYDRRISAQTEAAGAAAFAARAGDEQRFLSALRAQRHALAALGKAASAPIVTSNVAELAELGELEGAVFLPAGAGGGDIALYVGSAPPSSLFVERALALGLEPLTLRLGARGVHAA